jgi:hypothetical protein
VVPCVELADLGDKASEGGGFYLYLVLLASELLGSVHSDDLEPEGFHLVDGPAGWVEAFASRHRTARDRREGRSPF